MMAIHARGATRSHAGRFHLALAASAGLHFLLTSTISGLPESGAGRPDALPLTVRLDLPALASLPDAERSEARLSRDDSPPAGPSRDTLALLHPEPAADARRAPASVSLPLQQDTAVYAARDLDALPAPVNAIAIERLPGLAQGMAYRIELTIDEHGVVHKLDLLDPATPVPVKRALRAAFAKTRFIPARKDGRAVKSRIVLQVNPGSEARQRD